MPVVVVGFVALRPPLEWNLALVPATVPLGSFASVDFGGSTLPITVADAATVGVAVAWSMSPAPLPRRWLIWLVALITWSCVSVVAAQDVVVALASLKVVVQAAFLGLVAASGGRRDPRRTLVCICFGTLVMGLAIAARLLMQGALKSEATLVAAVVNKVGSDVGDLGRSNYLAALIVLAIPAAFVVRRHSRNAYARGAALAGVPVLALGILVSGSKSQVITAIILGALIVAVSLQKHSRGTRGWLAGVTGSVALALLLIALSPLLERMFESVSAAGGFRSYRTVQQREDIWAASIDAALSRPVTGVGLQNLETSDGLFTMAHNTPLQVAAETGLVGLFVFSGTILVVFRRQPEVFRAAALLIGMALLISGTAENTLRTREYDWVAWLLLGSLVATHHTKTDAMTAQF